VPRYQYDLSTGSEGNALGQARPFLESGDPATFAVVSSLLIVIAVAESWIPARRASHVDPIVVLRG
jgi:ABC-type antimicrobial peptide transport system permease subunit